MAEQNKVRVAVNGYGVIGKRVAHAVTLQDDMKLTGVIDVVADWRAQVAAQAGMRLFAATPSAADAMRKAGLQVHGTLEDVLRDVDVVVDCTPKRIAAGNVEIYRQRGVKYIVQGERSIRRPVTRSSRNPITRAHWASPQRASCPATPLRSCVRSRHLSAQGFWQERAARF